MLDFTARTRGGLFERQHEVVRLNRHAFTEVESMRLETLNARIQMQRVARLLAGMLYEPFKQSMAMAAGSRGFGSNEIVHV